jgi:hypothetical protein
MHRIAASLTFLFMITIGAKLAPGQEAGPAGAKQPSGQSEIRTAQTADKSHASPRSKNDVLVQVLPAWLEDPSVMDGSWRQWPSLTDF